MVNRTKLRQDIIEVMLALSCNKQAATVTKVNRVVQSSSSAVRTELEYMHKQQMIKKERINRTKTIWKLKHYDDF